jgi:hypothetical protein
MPDVPTLRRWLLGCTLLNVGVMTVWWILLIMARKPLENLWEHWFDLTPDQFSVATFFGIMFYKILVIVFFFVPYVALGLLPARATGQLPRG